MLVLLVIASACNLYGIGGGGGGGTCPPGVTGIHSTETSLLDPSTGQCQMFATGCDSQCGPCHNVDIPAWPQCDGGCTGLSESACLANAACHAAYEDIPSGSGSGSGNPAPTFSACWNMIASQPNPSGSCVGLDADTCATQHQCGSLMLVETDVEHFESCFAVTGTGGGCSTQDPGICYGTVQCNDAPPACPPGSVAGITNGCWSGYCIPTTKCPD